MPAMDRITSEQAFHDNQSARRSQTFAAEPKRYHFSDEDYLSHETWIAPAFHLLGDVRGLNVLDYGCGHGMAAVVLARRGARVTAFDLSHGYLDEARRRAAANGAPVTFVQADGARLPFADGVFDRVWGNAVLHHLDVGIAASELRRVLRPGGLAVFCEPWGENRFLRWARTGIQYPSKDRTRDEQPLLAAQLQTIRVVFPRLEARGYQFLSMARRVLPVGKLTAALDWCDAMLLSRVPQLERYCRYLVLALRS